MRKHYAIKDHQNSALAFVNESGAIVESYEYDAWGETKVFDSAGTQIAQSALGNRYLFQGREYDSATGLYYFRARWYDPETGRWLSKDPIGISGGLNLYEFCGNNPANSIDPTGLVDLNLSGESEADEYQGQLGYFDVAVHGNEEGKFADASGNVISVAEVYSQMIASGYEPGTPINLISCNAGKDGGDAQNLANAANATVKAATGTVTLPYKSHYLINPKTGKPITNPRKQKTKGKWIKKKPCKK